MHVEQRRGTIVESRHHVHVAVVDPDGRLVARAGDPDLVTFWRSAAKPFQALPLVADGVAEKFGLTREMLAIACASHSSEPAQVQLVRDFLAQIGCSERDLRCGPHPPLSEQVAKDYETRGVRLTAVYSNCSGKHAAMLALARHHGWPTEFYTGLAYARLVRGAWDVVAPGATQADAAPKQPLTTHHAPLLVEAMLRHPELLAGEGRPCTDMMRAHPGRVVTKVGADGVYCALLTQERLGVALKVEDGHGASAALAMAAVLAELGLRPQPATLVAKPVTNWRGEPVGDLRVNGGLER